MMDPIENIIFGRHGGAQLEFLGRSGKYYVLVLEGGQLSLREMADLTSPAPMPLPGPGVATTQVLADTYEEAERGLQDLRNRLTYLETEIGNLRHKDGGQQQDIASLRNDVRAMKFEVDNLRSQPRR